MQVVLFVLGLLALAVVICCIRVRRIKKDYQLYLESLSKRVK
jgi:hypothetical protein